MKRKNFLSNFFLPFNLEIIYDFDLKKLPLNFDLKQLVFVFINKNFLKENYNLINSFIDDVIKILKECLFLINTKDGSFIQIYYPSNIISLDFGYIFYYYINEKLKENKTCNILKENNLKEWNSKIFVENFRVFINFLFTNLNESKAFELNLPNSIQRSSSKYVLIPTAILWNTISDVKIGLSLDPIDYNFDFSLGYTKGKYQVSTFVLQKLY
ncbi:hypothetical protein GVAV_001841 [Gurleya vavrai]